MRDLSTLSRRQGANRALFEGEVSPEGYRFQFADEPVLVKGFRKMVRGLEFDVAEMALTTYLTAKEHGVAFTALPIFMVRDFHHGATQVLSEGRIQRPADLTGGRVGVNRGYTVTTGVWGRAALADAGLDLDSVTWVLSGDEHVSSYAPPPNVVPAEEGRSLEDMLLAGEVDAVVGASINHPGVVSLIADPEEAAMEMLRNRGIFPINHLLVLRDELLRKDVEVAAAVYEAFVESKRRYVDELKDGLAETEQDRLLRRVMDATGADPLPYGMKPNRQVLEELLGHAARQHILTRTVDLDRLFVPGFWS